MSILDQGVRDGAERREAPGDPLAVSEVFDRDAPRKARL
jgi:hypothetical protein